MTVYVFWVLLCVIYHILCFLETFIKEWLFDDCSLCNISFSI